MSRPVHGQHVGRQERMEQYRRWSGASPMDDNGQVKTADAGADLAMVDEQVRAIRTSFNAGVARVCLDCQDPAVVTAIKQQLTPEELSRVQFGYEGLTQPVQGG